MNITNMPTVGALGNVKNAQLDDKLNNKIANGINGQLDFSHFLKEAVNKVNESQLDADVAARDFIVGNSDSVHKLMIATEKAQLAMDMTLAVRNKVLDAYKELMRLQF